MKRAEDSLREQQGLSEGHLLVALQDWAAHTAVADMEARKSDGTRRTMFTVDDEGEIQQIKPTNEGAMK